MKEKKGFVFVETIIVIVVVMVLLVTIYSSFSLILNNIKRKENYENINDIYKINLILKLFTRDIDQNYVNLTMNNCNTYMTADCDDVMYDLGIDSIFINKISLKTILDSNPDFSAPFIAYINSLDKETNYIVITCIRNEQMHFASLEFEFNE